MSFMDRVREHMIEVDGRSVAVPENATARQILRVAGKDASSRDLVSEIDGGMTRIHPKDNQIYVKDGDIFTSQIAGTAGS